MAKSWLLYRRHAHSVGIQKEKRNLRQFKFAAAPRLVTYVNLTKKNGGQPSSLEVIGTVVTSRQLFHTGCNWTLAKCQNGLCTTYNIKSLYIIQ